jgi:membrane-associated protein
VSTVARIADALARAIAHTGEVAPLVLFFASFIEHVFPPFPGDLLVVLGSWYAVSGELSFPAALASVTAGALAGAWLDHRIGVALGRSLDRRAARRGALTEARLARFEASYRRFGGWLLLANRFLPGVRAFLFVAAGASGIPLRRVLLLGGISALLWNAALLAAGALLAENLQDLIDLYERYTRAASVALVACGIAAGGWLLLRRVARGARR